jgi:hypothetical protein
MLVFNMVHEASSSRRCCIPDMLSWQGPLSNYRRSLECAVGSLRVAEVARRSKINAAGYLASTAQITGAFSS